MNTDRTLKATGLRCPMPVVKAAQMMKEMDEGQVLEILADDEGAKADFPAWCEQTGNEFLGEEDEGDMLKFYIRKA